MQDELEELAGRLEEVAERITDLAMSALREALEDPDGDGSRPEIEKTLTRARRSVDKAAALLRGGSSSTMI